MAYVITEPCIGVKDSSCVEVSPVDASTALEKVPVGWQRFAALNAAYDAGR